LNIKKEVMIEKNILLENIKTVILSTVDDKGMPNASYAPFGIDDQYNMYIYVSELSKHTTNLIKTNMVSVMLIEDESKSTNIFARKRITINVKAKLIDRRTIDWYEKITNLDKRFGESMKYIKEMSDFHLFQLIPVDALLVYGFAKAYRLAGKNLDEIIHLNEKGHTKEPLSN
tara:strand:+ start:65 stop:583 length:519 start_codon:yes stop_codon:yes gene_type:complete